MTRSRFLQNRKGFTLVELLVSLSLFSVAVLLTAGSYLIIIGLNQRAQAVASLANNTAFVLENMTRLIRTGSAYSCGAGGDCTGGASFSFTDPTGINTITYDFVPAAGAVKGHVRIKVGSATAYAITDPALDITSLKFYVTGTGLPPGDYRQPFVRMTIAGTADAGHGQTFSFALETAAVMRDIDL